MADQLAPLQQFEYLPGMNLRVLQKDGEPWFVAADVCGVLGTRTDALKHILDPSELAKVTPNSIGGSSGSDRTIISESGLYLLVLKSRKPEAKAFQKWVTGEVLGGTLQIARDGASRWERPLSDSPPMVTPEGPYWPRSDGLGWQLGISDQRDR